MKRFTPDAIKSRAIERIKKRADAATVIDDGGFSNLLDAISEGIAEVARYSEYNTLESKWNTANNISSLTVQGSLIGRKRERPKSARGYIVVSHTDINGKDRLKNYGQYFFDLNQSSDFDEIDENKNAGYIERHSLVPWTFSSTYIVPKGTIFTGKNNLKYISTKPVAIRSMLEKYSTILNDTTKYDAFLSLGGWDGVKYLKVPVIQGVEREAILGTINGERFQSFKIDNPNIENASNSISKEYFYVEIIAPGGTSEKWTEIQKIRLAGPYDKVFESKLSYDGNSLIIKFGDGVSGLIPTTNAQVKLHYLETAGKAGNIDSNFQIQSMSFPEGQNMIDPRTNMASSFLSCTNISPISGGRDIEDEDEYRTNAPTSYLKSYTTAVKDTYVERIMKESPILLDKIQIGTSTSFVADQYDKAIGASIIENVSNEISTISESITITAVKANGDKLSDTEADELLKTVTQKIGNVKGPNDFFSYKEPNFIKLAPSIKITSSDIATKEEDIRQEVSQAISNNFSIFSVDFNNNVPSSKISHLASSFTYSDSVSLHLEALANVSYDYRQIFMKSINYNSSTINDLLLFIPFTFDKVYSQNKLFSGFKNYKTQSDYVIKADINFINNPAASYKDKTLFLIDSRIDDIDIQEAKNKPLDVNKTRVAEASDVIMSNGNIVDGFTIKFFDETSDAFQNRQCRVAQFDYISNITDKDFMEKAKSFQTVPIENRPYEKDTSGKNKLYPTSSVDAELRQSIDKNTSTIGNYCYKVNTNYQNYIDILFNESPNEENGTSANGYIVLPMSYLGLTNAMTNKPKTNSDKQTSQTLQELENMLTQFLSIKVYAQPLLENIECLENEDIAFIDDDDIKVEKVLKVRD